MRKLFFCWFCFFVWLTPYKLIAQDLNPFNGIIPPNPDAASLAKYVDFPVNLSTGVPQISIPLWNIQFGEINIPVTLSYHAGGIPVAETPSYVGLGWTLNAGGVITRTIRGSADDQMSRRDYYNSGGTLGILNTSSAYAVRGDLALDELNPSKYFMAAAGKVDLEPDLFYFNFCNHSGKFVFGSDGEARLIPRTNVVIGKEFSGNSRRLAKFFITTDDGYKYYFEEIEETVRDARTDYYYESNAPHPSDLVTTDYHSAWFLTKIVTPNGLQSITFEYDDIYIESVSPVSELYKHNNYTHGFYSAEHETQRVASLDLIRLYYSKDISEVTQVTSKISGKRLRKIIAPNQIVEFVPGAYRFDLKGDRVLDKIVVRKPNNEIVKQFKLSYKYFADNGIITKGSANPNADPQTNLRLILASVQEMGKTGGDNLPAYSFGYEEEEWLPDRLTSKAQDHWGYYNGANNTSLIPFLGANRVAVERFMKAGSLVKIIYPTGGYTQFIYEANFSNSPKPMIVGGLRICKKIDYDPVSGMEYFKRYDYNMSGYGVTYPNYKFHHSAHGYNGLTSWSAYYDFYASSSNSDLGNGGDGVIGYERVTVFEGDKELGVNGKTENFFTKLTSYYGSPTRCSSESSSVSISFRGSTAQFPFAPAISCAWGSGLLNRQVLYKYKDQRFRKVMEIENVYTNDYWGPYDKPNPETDVLAAKVAIESTHSAREYGISTIVVQGYFIPSRNINITKTIETEYDEDELPINVKITDVEYDHFSPHIYPSKTTTTLSNGKSHVEQILYPLDYTNSGNDFVGLMKRNHVINKPIEKISYKVDGGNVVITGGCIFTYKVGDHIGKLDKVFVLEPATPINKSIFKLSNKTGTNALLYNEGVNTSFSLARIDSRYSKDPEVSYDIYDEFGNPAQISTKTGGTTSFLWGYNQQYPIAKIENASFEDVKASLLGRPFGYDRVWGVLLSGKFVFSQAPVKYAFLDDEGYRMNLNFIRDDFPRAQVTTYTYDPLVGITSVTDSNGRVTYYEYDAFGRLALIKDNEENVVKTYEYSYSK